VLLISLKMGNSTAAFWILGIVTFSGLRNIRACCGHVDSRRDHFCNSKFVAIVNITKEISNMEEYTNTYEFDIKKEFSSTNTAGVNRITTDDSRLSTSVQFQVGDQYLIFTGEPGNEGVHIGLCNFPENWTQLEEADRVKIIKDMDVTTPCQ